MLESGDPAWRWRGLLTETLPYEVPVIFSNDVLYASLVKPSPDAGVRQAVQKMRSKIGKFTIPYTYRIAKDESRFTTLAIIHPNQQTNISDFYEMYRQSILDHCVDSEATLRRPIAEMEMYSPNRLDEEETPKQGIPHIVPEDGEIDVSRMTSYFSYGRYNLLNKFIDSEEYRRLEKRFRYLRTADVSKCFFNIYTHSFTWAIKGKDFAKSNSNVYSFEASFDRLMQRSNYNETNGIVVGPEVSRIFAEIILQDVDRRVVKGMWSTHDFVHNSDFALRRYVDDFFLFAHSERELDTLMSLLEAELERYKLFLNTAKTQTATRPFVTPITLARREIAGLIADIRDCLNDAIQRSEAGDVDRYRKKLYRLARDIRAVSERYKVGFSALSGSVLPRLRGLLGRSIREMQAATGDGVRAALGEMAAIILETAFYIAALDTRVRATYSLCQIVALLGGLHETDARDRLTHLASEELSGVMTSLLRTRDGDDGDCVELYNLMILGAHFLGLDFLRAKAMKDALAKVLSQPKPSYFAFITAKFCLLKDQQRYQAELESLNRAARDRIANGRNRLDVESELYLLTCDYLSSPDVTAADKRTLIIDLCGGRLSKAGSAAVGKYLGFVDWMGVRISHVLARRRLQPVYSWS